MRDWSFLIGEALNARETAYTPYSHFRVGAALLCRDGTVYRGGNIENASYTPTICAERVAIFQAVHDGKRDFEAIAICGGPEGGELQYCAPCGVCRQVMLEFCGPDFAVLLAWEDTAWKEVSLQELAPMGFGPGNLEKEDGSRAYV